MTNINLADGSRTAIKNCRSLLSEFERRRVHEGRPECQLLNFDKDESSQIISSSVEDLTVYNPTKPIVWHGRKYIFGRVEPRRNEDSRVLIFEHQHGQWKPVANRPVFNLQDPFYIPNVDGWQVFGGVEVSKNQNATPGVYIGKYRTIFYRYRHCIKELGKMP